MTIKNNDYLTIRYLIENKTQETNISNLSKGLGIDYKNAYLSVKRLEKESLLRLESFGKSKKVILDSLPRPLIFEAEYFRRNDLLRNKNLSVMLSQIKSSLKESLFVLLLFGSYAKKTHTKNSDIDLMFIVPNGNEEKFEKEVNHTVNLLPLPIHFLVFSEKEFKDMLFSREHNVAKEAVRNNVVLYGIEPYYELIK